MQGPNDSDSDKSGVMGVADDVSEGVSDLGTPAADNSSEEGK